MGVSFFLKRKLSRIIRKLKGYFTKKNRKGGIHIIERGMIRQAFSIQYFIH